MKGGRGARPFRSWMWTAVGHSRSPLAVSTPLYHRLLCSPQPILKSIRGSVAAARLKSHAHLREGAVGRSGWVGSVDESGGAP